MNQSTPAFLFNHILMHVVNYSAQSLAKHVDIDIANCSRNGDFICAAGCRKQINPNILPSIASMVMTRYALLAGMDGLKKAGGRGRGAAPQFANKMMRAASHHHTWTTPMLCKH